MTKHLPLLGHRMTRIFPILLFLGLAWGQNQYDVKHIIEQGGVYKKKFSNEVVNGEVFQMFGDMKVLLGKMKQGKKEGKWMEWHISGILEVEKHYFDGILHGSMIKYLSNGDKYEEHYYEKGEMVKYFTLNPDGSTFSEMNLKKGKFFNGYAVVQKLYNKGIFKMSKPVLIELVDGEQISMTNLEKYPSGDKLYKKLDRVDCKTSECFPKDKWKNLD